MLLEKITLTDFGGYSGTQEVVLAPPSQHKPIVLFGGLNGAGKTTILDALQLGLFGQLAKCSNREGMRYQTYLASCVNRCSAQQEAKIGLEFRHTMSGKETTYWLRRSWRNTGNGVREYFTVLVDGKQADYLSDSWSSHVESIMPPNIAHLFFFDGEQAEQYASSENSSELIMTTIMNLLGLDIVSRLNRDLQIIERRTKAGAAETDEKQSIDSLEEEISELQCKKKEMQSQLDQVKKQGMRKAILQEKKLTQQLKKLGGDLFERRADIEEAATNSKNLLSECESELRKLAEGVLAFGTIERLIEQLFKRDVKERKIAEAKLVLTHLQEVHTRIITKLNESNADNTAIKMVDKQFNFEVRSIKRAVKGKIENPLDEDTRLMVSVLSTEAMATAKEKARSLYSQLEELRAKANDASLELASVPQEDEISDVLQERAEVQHSIRAQDKQVMDLAAEIEDLDKAIIDKDKKLQTILTRIAERAGHLEDAARIIKYSNKARSTIEEFKHRVILRHIDRIQTAVLECLWRLLRRKNLICKVRIDPKTFELKLYDSRDRLLSPERLSAGERQLLAISLVWGMSRVSGRPLPTAIDTPLGRLDSIHRKYLVNRYFPQASHQVLLFSTDEEITGPLFKSLEKHVGRKYHIAYDEAKDVSTITEGYFS